MPENLGHQRAYATESRLRSWFKELDSFLTNEYHVTAADLLKLENANRVYNCDESGFPLHGTKHQLKIITKKGIKNVYRMTVDSHEQVTVLGTACANGELLKPMVILPGLNPSFNLEGVNAEDFILGSSPNGWISADTFFGWLSNYFYKNLQNKVQFPVLLLIDGHTSHINVSVSDFCRDKNIILFCFPAHASHLIQPLDVTVYGPLKTMWNESLDKFCKTYKGLSMTKRHFFVVFKEAWDKAKQRPQNVIKGFEKTGILPFNPDRIKYSNLYNPEAAKQELEDKVNRAKNKMMKEETLGIYRCIKVVESHLTGEQKQNFETRLEEGYNIEDGTDNNRLWRIYRDLKLLCQGKDPKERRAHDDAKSSFDVNIETLSQSTELAQEDVSLLTTPTSSNRIDPNTEDNEEVELPNIEAIASTSGANPHITSTPKTPVKTSSYEEMESPFRGYFKRSENILMSTKNKKTTVTKPKLPYAITGAVYNEHLSKKQQMKEDELRMKEERKIEREQKKKEREQKKKEKEQKKKEKEAQKSKQQRNQNQSSSEESEVDDELLTYDDSEEMEDETDENMCQACHGNNRVEEDNAWIGCNKCSSWFHRDCLSLGLENMSEDEIEELNFICASCQKPSSKQCLFKKITTKK